MNTHSLARTALAAAGLTAVLAPPALARNRFTLDPHAQSSGHLLRAPSGATIIGWTSDSGITGKAAIPKVCGAPGATQCGAPVDLPMPGAGADDVVDASDGVEGVFPVAGPGAVVYAFGPRESTGEMLRWTSTDGGASFGPATAVGSADVNGLVDPEDPLAVGGETVFALAGSGSVGASAFDTADGTAGAAGTFDGAGANVQTAALAPDAAGRPVIAYFNQGESPQAADSVVRTFRYSGTDLTATGLGDPANWTGPAVVGTGYEPVLSGGKAGLFAITEDTADASRPTVLDVRKDTGTAFGPPVTLTKATGDELFDGGAAAQSPSGRLAVLWPAARAGDGHRVMRLYTSTDAGATFTAADVAQIGDDYRSDRNAQVVLGDDGTGVFTFRDGDVLEVADLTPLAPSSTPVATPPAGPVFDPATGPFGSTSAHVGGGVVTLRGPAACVRTGTIVARLSIRARHGRLRVRKVVFRVDRRVVRIRRHRPFSGRFHVVVTPGSVHVLSAKVALTKGRHHHLSRTLRRRFTGCS